MRANTLQERDSDWAISFSWCGNMLSTPPTWMSIVSPRSSVAMVEHSICQPGRPFPQGEDQKIGPPFFPSYDFQRTKNFSYSSRETLSDAPSLSSSKIKCESFPYPSKERIRKKTSPSSVTYACSEAISFSMNVII